MATIKEQRNIVQINSNTVTKIANVFETARPKRLEVETFAMNKAFEYGLDVPRVRDYGLNENGKEYLIMDRIDGINVASPDLSLPMEDVYHDLGRRFSLIPPEFDTFGWIIPDIHTGTHASWPDFLSVHVEKYANGLCKRGSIDTLTTNQVVKLVEAQTPNIPQASLIHRDLKPLNLVVNNKQEVVVLDWECAMLGDPLFDAGVLHSRLYGDERLHKGFTRGLFGNIPNKDQCRRLSIYSLVNLVDTLFAYRERASKQMFTNLDEMVRNLNRPSPDFVSLRSKKIQIPNPLPSYTTD